MSDFTDPWWATTYPDTDWTTPIDKGPRAPTMRRRARLARKIARRGGYMKPRSLGAVWAKIDRALEAGS